MRPTLTPLICAYPFFWEMITIAKWLLLIETTNNVSQLISINIGYHTYYW